MPCFTFCSKIIVNGNTRNSTISSKDCFEIDTVSDMKNADKLLCD